MMRRLYAFLVAEYSVIALFVFSAMIAVGLAIDIMEYGTMAFSALGFGDTMLYFALRIPLVMAQFSSFALTITAMVTMTLIAQRSELVALLAAGIDYRRIFAPLFACIAVMSVLNVANEGWISPKALRKGAALNKQGASKGPQQVSDITLKTDTGYLYIGTIAARERTLLDTYVVSIGKDSKISEVFYAPRIRHDGTRWSAENGIRLSSEHNSIRNDTNVELPHITLLQELESTVYDDDWLTFGDLWHIITAGMQFGMNVRSYSYIVARKVLHVAAPLFLFFALFPVGFQLGRGRRGMDVVFATLAVLIVYQVLEGSVLKFCKSMGVHGAVPPLIMLAFVGLGGVFSWKRFFFWKGR